MFALLEPGLVSIAYEDPSEPELPRQGEAVAFIERELTRGPVALVFSVGHTGPHDEGRGAFWVEFARRHAPHLCALALASASLPVRRQGAAAMVSSPLREVGASVRVCGSEAEARTWARGRLVSYRASSHLRAGSASQA